jgi:hypothetical protein
MHLSIENDKCRFKKIYDSSHNVVAEVFEMMKEMREIFSKINPIVFHELYKYYPETWKEELKKEKAKWLKAKNS